MKTGKKIMIGGISLAVIALSVAGAGLWKSAHTKVEVTRVSDLGGGWYDDPLSSYGMVTDSDAQMVSPSEGQLVTAIHVTEGENVSVGDPLLTYDVSSVNLAIEMKKLSIEKTQNEMKAATYKLSVLKNTQPIPDATPVPVPSEEPTAEPTATPEVKPEKKQTEDAWNIIDSKNEEYVEENDEPAESEEPEEPSETAAPEDKEEEPLGSYLNPHRFIVTQDARIYGSLFKDYAEEDPCIMQFEIHQDDKADQPINGLWKISASLVPEDMADDEYVNVLAFMTLRAETEEEELPIMQEDRQPEVFEPVQDGYTASELAIMIRDAERSIKSIDLNLRRAQLELKQLMETGSDGIVRAKRSGIVTKACTLDEQPTDGSAWVVVSAGSGMSAEGTISELMLDRIQTGSEVYATNWETGESYVGTVTDVGTIPSENNLGGSGNPNVSWYPFTANFSDAGSLQAGSYVQMSFAENQNATDAIWLDAAYVRNDHGNYWVMKDENGKLKKQTVTIGKSAWGSMYEIRDGITADDYIAFPYGRKTVEGVRTERTDGSEDGMEVSIYG